MPCRCGSIGCWETEVGRGHAARARGHARRRRPIRHRRRAPRGGGRIAATALAALDESGRWLGIGLGGLVNLLNPRLVVLGGPLARLHPFVRSTLEAELDRYALPASRALVRIVPAALGVDAPLVGAAELAFEPLLADPAAWFGRANLSLHLASA